MPTATQERSCRASCRSRSSNWRRPTAPSVTIAIAHACPVIAGRGDLVLFAWPDRCRRRPGIGSSRGLPSDGSALPRCCLGPAVALRDATSPREATAASMSGAEERAAGARECSDPAQVLPAPSPRTLGCRARCAGPPSEHTRTGARNVVIRRVGARLRAPAPRRPLVLKAGHERPARGPATIPAQARTPWFGR